MGQSKPMRIIDYDLDDDGILDVDEVMGVLSCTVINATENDG